MQTAKDMGTPKTTATLHRDALNAQVTIWQVNATQKKYQVIQMCPLWWNSSCQLQGMYDVQWP
jgi:hypothetical protein